MNKEDIKAGRSYAFKGSKRTDGPYTRYVEKIENGVVTYSWSYRNQFIQGITTPLNMFARHAQEDVTKE